MACKGVNFLDISPHLNLILNFYSGNGIYKRNTPVPSYHPYPFVLSVIPQMRTLFHTYGLCGHLVYIIDVIERKPLLSNNNLA